MLSRSHVVSGGKDCITGFEETSSTHWVILDHDALCDLADLCFDTLELLNVATIAGIRTRESVARE